MVSIACCFMNFDVRIELILFICEKVKKMKCFSSTRCVKYLDSEYINSLKYKQSSRHRNGPSSILVKSGATIEFDGKTRGSDASNQSHQSSSFASESQPMTRKEAELKQIDETSQLLDQLEPSTDANLVISEGESLNGSSADSTTNV